MAPTPASGPHHGLPGRRTAQLPAREPSPGDASAHPRHSRSLRRAPATAHRRTAAPATR